MEETSGKKIKEDKQSKTWLLYLVATLVCLLVWFGGAWTLRLIAYKNYTSNPVTENVQNKEQKKDITVPALYGDSFGSVNALLSALALAGVIVTFFVQSKQLQAQHEDLRLQRDDMKLQREEMERQRQEFEAQNKTMKIQRFENTFFHMLDMLQKILDDISCESVSGVFKGREAIRYRYVHQPRSLEDDFYGLKQSLINKPLAIVDNQYPWTLLLHYYNVVYIILNTIDTSKDIEDVSDKQKYANVLRATLSSAELCFIYYHGLCEGNESLKHLIEKYHFFANLDEDMLSLSGDALLKLQQYGFIKVTLDPYNEVKKIFNEKGITNVSDYFILMTDRDSKDGTMYNISAFYETEQQKQYIESTYQSLYKDKH